MPKKPSQNIIDLANKHLNGIDVHKAIIQECPELRTALIKEGLIKEVAQKE